MSTPRTPSTGSTWPMVRETSLKVLDGRALSPMEYMEAYQAIFNKATKSNSASDSCRQMYDAIDALLSKWIQNTTVSHEDMQIRVGKLSNLFRYLERHFVERELEKANGPRPEGVMTSPVTRTDEHGQRHVQGTPIPSLIDGSDYSMDATPRHEYKTDLKHIVDLAEMYWQMYKA